MTRDAAATRARILDAAVAEFATHGLAGGRIERISETSGANPRSIYHYFGSKEQLFQAAVYKVLHSIGEAVQLTEEDLPGFAGRMFDQIMQHPEAVRLNYWRMLECPEAGPDDRELYAGKVAAMKTLPPFDTKPSSSSKAGSEISPADVLILVANMAAAWVSTSRDLRIADGTDPTSPTRIAAHRAALVEGVRRLLTPTHPTQM